MLKRYQVLLSDWLADYIKLISGRFDWSFSEVIRLMLAIEVLCWVSANYPKYPTKIDNKILAKKFKRYIKRPAALEEELHKALSGIYFEARKAVEFVSKQKSFVKPRNSNKK